ncbi:MAG TPA: hypothetical protein VGF45_04770 [Polyangia bacterium]
MTGSFVQGSGANQVPLVGFGHEESDGKYAWQFKPRFRRHAFGWKSQPAIARVKEAVAEIKKVARKDPALAAEGAVVFIEKVSLAIEQVDGSSGSMGAAVNNAIAELVPVIAEASADALTRNAWLDRIWSAQQDDDIPYLESLGDHWGALCASKDTASAWADRLVGTLRMAWSPDPTLRGFFKGTANCLSPSSQRSGTTTCSCSSNSPRTRCGTTANTA